MNLVDYSGVLHPVYQLNCIVCDNIARAKLNVPGPLIQ
jgi:hypothetical protein